MMNSIKRRSEIIKLLNCQNTLEDQKKGRELALKEGIDFVLKCFAYPGCAENCALIVTALSYEKTEECFDCLFLLSQNLHYPWELEIFSYLINAPLKILKPWLTKALNNAILSENYLGILFLVQMLEQNKELNLSIEQDSNSNLILDTISSKNMISKAKIIRKLHIDNSKKIQQEGIIEALGEDKLDFVMRYLQNFAYTENCIEIFCSLPYEICEPYFEELLNWVVENSEEETEKLFNYLTKVPKAMLRKVVQNELKYAAREKREDAIEILNKIKRFRANKQ